jgi:hypothetical protein
MFILETEGWWWVLPLDGRSPFWIMGRLQPFLSAFGGDMEEGGGGRLGLGMD